MSEPLEGRRYGRTTLMLQEARRLAQEGRAVYVVAVSAKDASRLRRMFGDDAGALGVKFESSEELPIRDGRRLRGAHPNCVVLVDHYVVESENTALRARIAALEEIEGAAIWWWEGHRPTDFSEDEHIANPTVNAGYTERSETLALAVARHVAAVRKGEVKS